MSTKKIPFPIVQVWWKDHYTNTEWTAIKDMSNAPEMCLTVGYLVRDADDHVLIASTVDPNDPMAGTMGNTWYILRNCITDIKVLKKGVNAKR